MDKLVIIYLYNKKSISNKYEIFELNNVEDIFYFFEYIEPYCITYDMYKKV